jgi:hypothetical protein
MDRGHAAKPTAMTRVDLHERLMQLPQLTTRLPRKTRRERPDRRRAPRAPEAMPSREAAERRDARRGGGPQDTALYACQCGYVFTAQVSTSVECPHCGCGQAW